MASKRYQIVPATMAHVYALAAVLRDDDRQEVEAAGLDPRKSLRDSFRASSVRKSVFVDGEIAAMWGIGGSLLGHQGESWLLTSAAIERIPISFVKEGRREVASMCRLYPTVRGLVAAKYDRAVRFLQLLGFSVDDPKPYGPNGELFRWYHIEGN